MRLLICTQAVDTQDPVLGFFHRWILEFASQCEEITVICLYEGTHSLPENVKVLSLGKEAGSASRLTYARKLLGYVWGERNRYDVVFVHMNPEYLVACGLLWWVLGKRVGFWYMHKSVTEFLQIAEKLADVIFTGTKESFRLQTNKLKVMGHGIDVDMFRPLARDKSGDEVRLITVGRLSPKKQVHVMLETMKELKDKHINVHFTVVGDAGTPEQRAYVEGLKEQTTELDLEKEVLFAGAASHDQIPKVLASADIFLNISETGSLDKAILEAMASGVLVVTNNDSAKPILQEPCPECIPESGEPTPLANTIIALSEKSADERRALASRLRAIVESDHSLNKLIENILWNLERNK